MNVGIITIHNHLNYGAALQAFALNAAVRQLGHGCRTIDTRIDPGTGRRFAWTRRPGRQITNLYLLLRWGANRRFHHRFLDFIREHIPMTETAYPTLKQLRSSPPAFDAFVTGSDQVWHPLLLDREIGEAYHLCFAPPGATRRISYAPSFGVDKVPERHRKKIGTFLNQYHSISVREKQGQEIIFDLSGRKAAHVLDPTLLLRADRYESICRPPSLSGEFILVYPMELGKNLSFLRLVKQVKQHLDLPVVCLLPLNFDFRWLMVADKVVLDAGPLEFLGYIKNAAFVCTNSFHGTTFSILFRKNFLSTPHSTSNSRIHSLLEITGLPDRQINNGDPIYIHRRVAEPVDYAAAIPLLQRHISASLKYLSTALAI